ncbi:MAG: tetratricopeptide repeat protein, partial [bacterium]|nr:tetratricopeptide repeat protein [bacterium]
QDLALTGWALINRARIARDLGDLDAALQEIEKCLALWSTSGTRTVISLAKILHGGLLHELGEPDRARLALSEGLDLCRAIQSPWGVALTHLEQARTMIGADNPSAAARVKEALEEFGRFPDQRGVADCLDVLAEVSSEERDGTRAADLRSAAAALRERTGCSLAPIRALKLDRIRYLPRRHITLEEAIAVGLRT